MGACVSVNHKASSMTVHDGSFVSTNNKPDHKAVIHSTQSHQKLFVMDGHVAVKPQLPTTFSDYGSKEETFFDSQAWLDSDYEDEFMSVNGEFTPSRGNTPVHHTLISSRGNRTMDHVEPHGFTTQPSPTPTEKKKRLLDFFKESPRVNHGSHNEEFDEPPNYKYGDEMMSKNNVLHSRREKSLGSMQGCFTSLLSIRGTGRQNKKSSISGLKLAHNPVVILKTDSINTHNKLV